jgi:nitroreductase
MKFFVKKIIPKLYLIKIKKLINNLTYISLSFFHKNKFICNLYYLFSSEFSNEHQGVLKGRKAYHDSLKNIGESCALLRRNTHRLEKGLIMQPRRSVFAQGFIQETVDCYVDAVSSALLSEAEKKWATDVLDEYFKIVGSTALVDQAKSIYKLARQQLPEKVDLVAEFPSTDQKYKPYPYEHLPDADVSFIDLKRLFVRRRSVRWYQDRQVPLALIQQAANIASFAPSACNRQPYRFIFCNKKAKAVAIAQCAGGTAGFAENLPAMIVIVGDLAAYPYERDRHLIYIDGSLAAMQLMLGLETLGLSTCSINWPEVDSNERNIRKIINLKDYERIVMLLAVGYADKSGGIPYSQKKENKFILEDISQ